MYILGYDIDIYTVIIVVAGIFVFSIILMISSSMRPKKHVSKKESRRHDELEKTLQGKYEKQLQVKVPQDQQAIVMEGSHKELNIKPTQEFQNNSSPQQIQSLTDVAKRAVASQESQDSSSPQITSLTDAAKSPAAMTRLWKTEDATKDKEPQEQIEDSNDLDDIFSDTDEPEDPALSELANDLIDVNLDTLSKLGKEVSQVISKGDHDRKRGRDYD